MNQHRPSFKVSALVYKPVNSWRHQFPAIRWVTKEGFGFRPRCSESIRFLGEENFSSNNGVCFLAGKWVKRKVLNPEQLFYYLYNWLGGVLFILIFVVRHDCFPLRKYSLHLLYTRGNTNRTSLRRKKQFFCWDGDRLYLQQ